MSGLMLSLFIGLATILICWSLYIVLRQVPQEDRHFLDRPALGYQCVWPLIQVLVYYSESLLSKTKADQLQQRLRAGGVEYALTPHQFYVSKWIAALGFGGVVGLCLHVTVQEIKALAIPVALAGFYYPDLWLKEVTQKRAAAIHRQLPFYLDVITLAVEAGNNLTGGITQAVQKTSDSPLRREFSRVLRDVRSGKTRAEALRDFSDRTTSSAISRLVSGLIQAEKTGASLAPLLKSQAQHLRTQRFQRAEKLALEAPVKILAPLTLFIFPTTALVIGFILMSKAIIEGLITWQPLVWAYHWPG